MELSPSELAIQKKALDFAKKNRTRICRRLTDTSIYIPEQQPVSVFMSGSPGAGKTESSKELVAALTEDGGHVLRLDPDDLREEFEDYNGNNSYLFQAAVITLVERAMDMIFKNNQSFLLDGTTHSHHSDVSSLQPYLDPAYTLEVVREIVGASMHQEKRDD